MTRLVELKEVFTIEEANILLKQGKQSHTTEKRGWYLLKTAPHFVDATAKEKTVSAYSFLFGRYE